MSSSKSTSRATTSTNKQPSPSPSSSSSVFPSSSSSRIAYLIGDVGGTNARLQLYETDGLDDYHIADKTYPSKQHPSLIAVLQIFIDTHYPQHKTQHNIASCCIALAGPVVNNTCLI